MASVTGFTMNMSGVVAQANNQVNSFGVWFDSRYTAELVGSQAAFAGIFGSQSATITALLAALLPTVVDFAYPVSTIVVDSFTMVISGVVSYSDNTVGTFSFEVRDVDGYPDTEVVYNFDGGTDFNNLCADPTSQAIIVQMWEDLVGSPVTFSGGIIPSPYGPPPVNLHTAANFQILSKTGITNTGAFPLTFIEGTIGTSPITGAAITGITCSNVAGAVDTVDGLWVPPSGPSTCQATVPSVLTQAVTDMQTAYTTAIALSPGFTNAFSSDLGLAPGGVIAPGVYKWTGALGMSQNVALNGGPNATWVFIVSGAFTVAAGKVMSVTGGATAANVLFAVISCAPGANSHLEGNILASTTIALSTGASVNGKLLAQTAVTLLSNVIS